MTPGSVHPAEAGRPSSPRKCSPGEGFKLSRASGRPPSAASPWNPDTARGPEGSFEEPLWREPWGGRPARTFPRPSGVREKGRNGRRAGPLESRGAGGRWSDGKVHRSKCVQHGDELGSREGHGEETRQKVKGRRGRENEGVRAGEREDQRDGKTRDTQQPLLVASPGCCPSLAKHRQVAAAI